MRSGPAKEPQDESPPRNLAPEFDRLLKIATIHPEIIPPVAELAFKTGYPDKGAQFLKMALERDTPGLQYHALGARYAKEDRRHDEAFDHILSALRSYIQSPERYPDPDDAVKLLHLVRLGFTILLFDKRDPHSAPAFVAALGEELPKLAPQLGTDPFYQSLIAQILWYTDRDASEAAWDKAAELGEAEFTHNARGTWYKDAEQNPEKAEQAYRNGLKRAPNSSLLMHNLAQVLLIRAAKLKDDPEVRWLLDEIDRLLHEALRSDCAKGLRRHIHNTRDELRALAQAIRGARPRREREPRRPRDKEAESAQAAPEGGATPEGTAASQAEPKEKSEADKPAGPSEEEKAERAARAQAAAAALAEERRLTEEALAKLEVGQVIHGKVKALQAYGAFIAIEEARGFTGLLHRSELDYGPSKDPATVLQVGQDLELKIIELSRPDKDKEDGKDARVRIGLSKKALLPPPERPAVQETSQQRPPRREGEHQNGRQRPDARPHDGGRPQRDQRPRQGEHGGPRGENREARPDRQNGPPRPERQDRPDRPDRQDRSDRNGPRRDRPPEVNRRPGNDKLASLGEMLLAKLQEQKDQKEREKAQQAAVSTPPSPSDTPAKEQA